MLSTVFLDSASAHPGDIEIAEARKAALALVACLRLLRQVNSTISLNCDTPLSQSKVSNNLYLQKVLGGERFKEEWRSLRRMADRSPLHSGLDEWRSLVELMDCRTQAGKISSEALAWAHLLDTAAVSFGIVKDWCTSWVSAQSDELDDQGDINTKIFNVRNISKQEHVNTHKDWLTSLGFEEAPTGKVLWEEREARFPGLRFLPRVRDDFTTLSVSGAPYIQAINSLQILSADLMAWPLNVAWPNFSQHCSPESATRQELCKFMENKINTLFEWHARFTGNFPGRIHFRVAESERKAVVAYVGKKL